MMASKLPGGLTERWNSDVSKIRRHHRREPDLEDLMNDPLFSRKTLSELNTVKERPARRNKVKNVLTVSDERLKSCNLIEPDYILSYGLKLSVLN